MKPLKFLGRFVGIMMLIMLGFYIFGATGPIRAAYSKKILSNNPIVPELNADCIYVGPSRFLSTSNPHLSCISTQRFGENEQVPEIERIEKVLQSNGWVLTEKYHPRNVTYRKGKLKFNVQPYYWQSDVSAKENPQLLMYFAHMTLADYGG